MEEMKYNIKETKNIDFTDKNACLPQAGLKHSKK
jgi:hypothetical protein